jgi:hypothetical protein
VRLGLYIVVWGALATTGCYPTSSDDDDDDRYAFDAGVPRSGDDADASGTGVERDVPTSPRPDISVPPDTRSETTDDDPRGDAGSAGDIGPPDPSVATGGECRYDGQCRGGTCLVTDDFPDGYCTSSSCQSGQCSGSNGVCVDIADEQSRCLVRCEGDDDCRDGLTCQSFSGRTERLCLASPRPDPPSFDQLEQTLGVDCSPKKGRKGDFGQRYTFEFDVSKNANGFVAVPFVYDGRIRPRELVTPSKTVDLVDNYKYQNLPLTHPTRGVTNTGALVGTGTYGRIAHDWPIMVPIAPQYASYLEPGGSYDLTIESNKTSPCLYVMESTGGSKVDVNLHLIGYDDRGTRQTAPFDPELQRLLNGVQRIFDEQANIDVDFSYFSEPSSQTDWSDVPPKGFNRQFEHLMKLSAFGRPPGRSLDALRSIDLFLIFDPPGYLSKVFLGRSMDIPGAAGLHGNSGNGVVVSLQGDTKFDRNASALVVHELAHYLGLRHPSEVQLAPSQVKAFEKAMGLHDPIEDTRTCDVYTSRDLASTCPNVKNLLFPISATIGSKMFVNYGVELTDGQVDVLRAHPLTK